MGEASCFNCFGYGDVKLVEVALLCRVLRALDPMATCNVQDLLNEAQCFLCLSPQQWELIKLQLLCNIEAASGGGISGGSILCGLVDPVADPGVACAVFYRTDTGSIWLWDGAAWQQKVV